MRMELDDYILQHISPEPKQLHDIERKSNLYLLNGRMCSGHLQGRILKMLTEMISPQRVLELGTFSGYSALCIAEGLPEKATIDTVEIDDELEDLLTSNFSSSPYGHKIRLHIGDAADVCSGFDDESFDMIFIDADKRQYPSYYHLAMRLLRPGGYILADNTLWDGHVIKTPDSRDRQTAGVMEFNDIVAADTRVEKVILPIRDGLTIIHKLHSTEPTNSRNLKT